MTIKEARSRLIMNIYEDNLFVADAGKKTERYIDRRSVTDKNFNTTVFPIGENIFFYAFVCPNCQRIHVQPKTVEAKKDENGIPYQLFQIPESEVAAEDILEWKEELEADNNMIKISDPDGMTVYKELENMIVYELRSIALKTEEKSIINAISVILDGIKPELIDSDLK